MTDPIIVDLDDFCDEYQSLDVLERIKAELPRFLVTLFAIPARTSSGLLKRMFELDWVDLVPHGWEHFDNRECEHWDYQQMIECLQRAEDKGFRTKGFKAPGWEISDACYHVLMDRGYWVADHPRNAGRRPGGLPAYVIDSRSKIHGHVGGPAENALARLEPQILAHKDRPFGFVRDAVQISAIGP